MLDFTTHYGESEPIAVIGLSGRFPGAPDIRAFWQTLVDGRSVTRAFTPEELREAGVSPAGQSDPAFVGAGAVLEGADEFDAALFGYAPAEAELIDPQQRLFLQEAWRALESAGYAPLNVPHRTGVFGSARMSTYPAAREASFEGLSKARGMLALMGNDKDYLCLRVAYKLNLQGPAMTLQTACSSSLVAVHVACESLRNGECDMALAGGTGLSFPQCAGYRHQPGMIFSPDATCRPFDASANGTFAGHGVGLVVLRRLEDALRDNDPVLAVLRGSAFNNDGNRKAGFTAPSGAGQQEVIRKAWAFAEVDGNDIDLIEAHGTGTPLGDPVEVRALREAFSDRDRTRGPVALGSLKGSFGHMDTAAGIAGLMKAILAVHHGVIPPSAGFETPGPDLDLDSTPFQVPVTARTWTRPIRTAVVSSFGIGGTNCHVVVQSSPGASQNREGDAPDQSEPGWLLLSAASEASLRGLAGSWARAWDSAPPEALARTALIGRQLDLDWRLAVPALAESREALEACALGATDPLLLGGHLARPGPAAWVFPGHGSQWPGMGRALYDTCPAFAEALDRCTDLCRDRLPVPLKDIVVNGDEAQLLRPSLAQPALLGFELALAAHWQALGLEPDRVLGHSWGEYAAAVVAGLYDEADMLGLAIRSGALMEQAAPGAMVAVFADTPDLRVQAERAGLDLAAENGTTHCVFSGPAAAVAAFSRTCEDAGLRVRPIAGQFAGHSRLLDPVRNAFEDACRALPEAREPRIPFVSGVDGSVATRETFEDGLYWAHQMRAPTLWHQARETLSGSGTTVCLEIGPASVLSDMGEREGLNGVSWIASCRRGHAGPDTLREAAARLFVAGQNLHWPGIFPASGEKASAPTYVFDARRYWWSGPEDSAAPVRETEPAALLLPAGRNAAARELAALDFRRLSGFYSRIGQLHAIYVDRVVEQALKRPLDRPATAGTILRAGRVLPRHRQLLVRLLDACVEDGIYAHGPDGYCKIREPDVHRLDAIFEALLTDCEGLESIPATIRRAGENLFAMLTGEVDPVSVIFPSGQSRGVEVLYEDLSFGRCFNRITAAVLSDIVALHREQRPEEPFRILEVGGGTGGTTSSLLPVLAEVPGVQYDFTDISAVFTRRAATKFAAWPFVRYRELDLERSAADQGFQEGHYDLIVAANVIHATRNIGDTLANLRPLLKPGGRLLMREITRTVRLFDFVFGPLVAPLTDLEARHGELFLPVNGWRSHCHGAGFETLEHLPGDSLETGDLCEHILLASLRGALQPGHTRHTRDETAIQPGSGSNTLVLCRELPDCAGDETALRTCLEDLCRTGFRDLPGATRLHLQTAPLQVPDGPVSIRAYYTAGLLGQAKVRFEARAPGKPPVPLAVATTGPATGLEPPAIRPAPDTLYRMVYTACPVPGAPGGLDPAGLPDDCLQALRAGEVPETPGRHLVLLDTGSALDRAEAARCALERWSGNDLVFVTREAWNPDESGEVDPDAHAVSAFLRVAARETRRRRVQLIDLARNAPWSDLVPGLCALEAGATAVIVRNGIALVPGIEPAPPQHACPSLPPGSLDTRRLHVITGAFGGLGRLAAHWLAGQGVRRIALLAPRAPRDAGALLAALEDGERREVIWRECDCADPEQLIACLEALAADGGIDGVFHAAGVLDDAPAGTLDPERMKRVFDVKAGAARTLYDTLDRLDARYLVLYSSAAATLAPAGQGAHALASAALDALARNSTRDPDGPRVMSIAWGAWAETGRATEEDRLEKLAADGMLALSPDEGLWHLEQALMDGAPFRLAMRLAPSVTAAENAKAPEPAFSSPVPAPAPGTGQDAGSAKTDRPPREEPGLSRWLEACIREQLRLEEDTEIEPARNLVELGLDSLMFLDLASIIEQAFGVAIEAATAYEDLSLASLATLIRTRAPEAEDPETGAPSPALLVHDAAGRHDPFPLTPIQHAYWLGRTDLIGYGGVACHVVFEWDKDSRTLDPARLENAWNALVRRHDMLRSVIGPDGLQRVLETVPEYRFAVEDLTACTPKERDARLEATRNRLCTQVLPTDRWPLFEVCLSRTGETGYRLHMNLDLLQFDTQSFKVMMDDWAALYRSEALPPLGCVFRDYVLADLARRETPGWKKAWCGWQDLLADLPPAPVLPLQDGEIALPPRFGALSHRIPADRWNALKAFWKTRGITPSAALLTLYSRVLALRTRHPRFTLNVTCFNRRPCHPDVPRLIGDFTSVMLVDYDDRQGDTLLERMEALQQRFWQRLGLAEVNGVEVLREWGRLQRDGGRALMPYVFTSMLGMTFDGESIEEALGSFLGDPEHAFTQTPQVWLDHQVMEGPDGLVLNWFFMEDLFPGDLVQTLFDLYVDLVERVATDPHALELPDTGPDATTPALAEPVIQAWAPVLGDDAALILTAEQAVRALPVVRDARVRPGDDLWQIDLVPEDRIVADAAEPLPGLPDLSLPPPDPARERGIEDAWQFLEARALDGIVRTLEGTGLFSPGVAVTREALAAALDMAPRYSALLRQWLDLLTDRGLLEHTADGYRRSAAFGTPLCAPEPGLHDGPEDAPWLAALIRYLDRCVAAHRELFQGRVSAVDLLFGEGDETTRSLYSDHPAMQLLNDRAARVVSALADRHGPLDILEVGAGTGATTGPVLEALGDRVQRYRFTDVSPLFLQDARERFAGAGSGPRAKAMEFAVLDINAPVDPDVHPYQEHDLVIASNVLHDASHIGRTLRRLRRLLKPGGALLLLEATTRGSALQAASVGFLEGLAAYQDERLLTESPMLDVATWREVLQANGFVPGIQWPDTDTTPLRQHLLFARAPGVSGPGEAEIRTRIQALAGRKLPPFRLRRLETLPAAEPVSACTPAGTTEAPEPEAVADTPCVPPALQALWEELLGHPVHPDTDFFAAGGDSLMATRLISRLNREGYRGTSLQTLFRHGTLGAFCSRLPARSDTGTPATVLLSAGPATPATFMLPASDGDVGVARHFAERLGNQVTGLVAPDPEELRDFADLVQRHTAVVSARTRRGDAVEIAGWSSGAHLAAAVARRLKNQGRRPSLVLIDPVHRRDFAFRDTREFCRLMAAQDPRLALPPGFEALPGDQVLPVFADRVHRAALRPSLRTVQEVEHWLRGVRRLLDLLQQTAPPDIGDLPCLWIRAARRPASWACPTKDWAGLAQAVCETVDADHREIMTSCTRAAEAAGRVTHWRSVYALEEQV